MEDYGFEYSDEEPEEQDVDIENQYYNSKGSLFSFFIVVFFIKWIFIYLFIYCYLVLNRVLSLIIDNGFLWFYEKGWYCLLKFICVNDCFYFSFFQVGLGFDLTREKENPIFSKLAQIDWVLLKWWSLECLSGHFRI